MRRRTGILMLLASLATASAHEGYGHGYDDYHHEDPYGHHEYDDHEDHHGYGHEHEHHYEPVKCKEGFYGQCKKDPWGRCINPPIVGVWELSDGKPHSDYSDHRWLMQVDEYDFCRQSGNYRITSAKGLTESVAYGTYVWEDKKYFRLKDFSFVYGYKYPYPIVGTVHWKNDFKLITYDKAKSVKPGVGITKDLYGKIIDKEYAHTVYRRLKGPDEGIEY